MKLLPMLGKTHGNRNAATCHYKCADACAKPIPNKSAQPTFREIATAQLSRRRLLAGAGALTAGIAAGSGALDLQTAAAKPKNGRGRGWGSHRLQFEPIDAVSADTDDVIVPDGYEWGAIIRWGDPLFSDSPAFDPEYPDPDAQERQFGYNNDYLDIIVTDERGRKGLLVCNHEYTNRNVMFPPTSSDAEELGVIRTLIAAHGFSVVELERRSPGKQWSYVRDGDLNRRITGTTRFELDGPAAGTELLITDADPDGQWVHGTLGNCAGGTTPWGTILSGEENFNGYFIGDPSAADYDRYGFSDSSPSNYGFEAADPRFDTTQAAYANEKNRFGYVIEVDPYDPTSTPKKHTALGRFKHEAANVHVDSDNNVVCYMGDDERNDYLYKFVASQKYVDGDREHNLQLLTEGDLYVAKFSGEMEPDNSNLGTGEWLPLTQGGESVVPGMSTVEVLVYTRLAADKLQPTPMDRPEDVEPSPLTGKVYMACTNNTARTPAEVDAPNPRPSNKDGHVIELTETDDDVTSTTFDWNLFIVCGDENDSTTYFSGWDGPVAPISSPDNVAFDSEGNLWISTDGQPGAIAYADALHKVPVEGEERGHLQQFLSVPVHAETCGPVIHDEDGSVFVAVQHPGDGGEWDAPASTFPYDGEFNGPRPSIVQVTRRR